MCEEREEVFFTFRKPSWKDTYEGGQIRVREEEEGSKEGREGGRRGGGEWRGGR